MKIKSIKPTDGLKQIEFGELKPAWDEHIAGGPRPQQRVLAPGGWAPVESFEKIKTGPTVVVRHRQGELTCDPKHRLRKPSGEWVFAGDLPAVGAATEHYLELASAPGDFTNAYTVAPGPTEDLYDIQVPAPHAYFTSGLVSHNSILLCCNAVHQARCGNDVLLVSFEMSTMRVAMRCAAAMSGVPMANFHEHRDKVTNTLQRIYETNKAKVCIWELPPDECSVDHVYTVMRQLRRTRGWAPKVLCLDYLELMLGRRASDNRDDYSRQKHVATQVRGLAKNEKVAVFTATQTNRQGTNTAELIDVNKMAESFGKAMPMDYIVSLNQNTEQRTAEPPQLTMFVVKNRNGPKYDQIQCTINYGTMQVAEIVRQAF